MPLEDIPAFLRIPQDERKAAWEKYRSAQKPPPAEKPAYKRITDIPGAPPNDDTDS